jgi:hypothetical protein
MYMFIRAVVGSMHVTGWDNQALQAATILVTLVMLPSLPPRECPSSTINLIEKKHQENQKICHLVN